MSLLDGDGNLMIFNADHRGIAYNQYLPSESPMPRLNSWSSTHSDSAIYQVISRPGTYYVEVAGQDDASTGQYRMDLVVARPGMEAEPMGAKQIVFVDFDGAKVNMSKFGYPGSSGNKTLSPMRDFLPRWGLSEDEATENAVIDAILANMEENLSQDMRERGLNGDFAETGVPGQFDIEIRNSRDHIDEFGKNPYVARVIIGGTEAEAELDTFGLAESIDVGNFKFDDDALVLLDRRSEPAGHPQSLNTVPIDDESSMVELVGVGIGNLASHELGHNFGNFHTDRWNDVLDVMDQGGPRRIIDAVGAGPDGIFGSGDDIDRAFGVDAYCTVNAFGYPEFFTGVEDTLNTIAFGLSTGKAGSTGQTTAYWAAAADLLVADQESEGTSGPSSSLDLAVLAQVGEIDQGPGVHTYYPSMEISAGGGVYRNILPWGVDENVTFAGYWGGIVVDPVDDTFWAAHQYARPIPDPPPTVFWANWGTWIGNSSITEDDSTDAAVAGLDALTADLFWLSQPDSDEGTTSTLFEPAVDLLMTKLG
jgi:hypothetical protein